MFHKTVDNGGFRDYSDDMNNFSPSSSASLSIPQAGKAHVPHLHIDSAVAVSGGICVLAGHQRPLSQRPVDLGRKLEEAGMTYLAAPTGRLMV